MKKPNIPYINEEGELDFQNINKIKKGVFIPKDKKKKRGNPNEYFIIPQNGEPTEYNIEDKYCPNCKKIMPCKNMFVSDPLQPEDVGIKGEKVEPYWINVCKKCKSIVEEGFSIIENSGDVI